MLKRSLLFCVLPLLWAPALSAGGKAETPPALVVQVRSLDRVIEQAKLILSLAGHAEAGDKVADMIKAKIGAAGLASIDRTKPLGVIVRFGKDIDDISPLVLVPIADEKAFLKLLEDNKLKVTKGKKDIYTIVIGGGPIEVEAYARFAGGYLHLTVLNQNALDDGRLLADPAKALGGDSGPTFSASLRLDQLPAAAKLIALGEVEKFLTPLLKEKDAGESKLEQAFRNATLEMVGQAVKAVLMDGKEVQLTVDIDAKTKKLKAHFSLTGQSGSGLAKAIDALGEHKSQFAGLLSDKAMFNGLINVALPEKMKKAMSDFFADLKEKAAAELTEKDKQLQARALFAVLEPTFTGGVIDAFFQLNPEADKSLGYLIGLRVKDGKKMEKHIRGLVEEALKLMPEKERDKIQLDFAKAGGTSIHRLEIPATRELDALKAILGEAAVYFAFRDDALFIALGKGGKENIEKALPAVTPGKGPALLYRADFRGVLQLMAGKGLDIPDADKLFPPGGDNAILIRIDGGAALTGRVELPLNLFLMSRVVGKKGG